MPIPSSLPFFCHAVILVVDLLLSVRCMMYPAHVYFLFSFKMSSTFVCSIILDVFFLSLHVITNITFPFGHFDIFFFMAFARLHVSDPNYDIGWMLWLWNSSKYCWEVTFHNISVSIKRTQSNLYSSLIFVLFLFPDLDLHWCSVLSTVYNIFPLGRDIIK